MSLNEATTSPLQQHPAGTSEPAPKGIPSVHVSVHVRALATWLVIFPLVALGMTAMGFFAADWPPVLRALALTAVVVPLAVYVGVPRALGLYGRFLASRRR